VTETPPTIPHTLTPTLEDGQTTAKGLALVALADATDATAAAIVHVLAARQAADIDCDDVGRLIAAAGRTAIGADWIAEPSDARSNIAIAAALLVMAIETVDAPLVDGADL
jgi:hypothetical protein